MKKHLSPVIALLVAVMPLFADASSSQRNHLGTFDVSVTGIVGANPGTQRSSATSGHFDLSGDPGGKTLDGTISVGSRMATIHVEDGLISFGDGYSIEIKALVDNSAESVSKIVLSTPTGRATAVSRYNKANGQGSTTGMAAVQRALAGSADVATVREGLPALANALKTKLSAQSAPTNLIGGKWVGTPAFEVGSDSWGWCVFYIFMYIIDTAGLILACGVPEPLEPIACAFAIVGFTGGGLLAARTCSEP